MNIFETAFNKVTEVTSQFNTLSSHPSDLEGRSTVYLNTLRVHEARLDEHEKNNAPLRCVPKGCRGDCDL